METGSTRSHWVENSTWKRLWTCRKAVRVYWMNEWLNEWIWPNRSSRNSCSHSNLCTQFPHHIAWQPERWSSLWYYVTVEWKDRRAWPQHKTVFSCKERLIIIKLVAAARCFIKRGSLQLLNFLAKLYRLPFAITLTSGRPFLHVLLLSHTFLTSTDLVTAWGLPAFNALTVSKTKWDWNT